MAALSHFDEQVPDTVEPPPGKKWIEGSPNRRPDHGNRELMAELCMNPRSRFFALDHFMIVGLLSNCYLLSVCGGCGRSAHRLVCVQTRDTHALVWDFTKGRAMVPLLQVDPPCLDSIKCEPVFLCTQCDEARNNYAESLSHAFHCTSQGAYCFFNHTVDRLYHSTICKQNATMILSLLERLNATMRQLIKVDCTWPGWATSHRLESVHKFLVHATDLIDEGNDHGKTQTKEFYRLRTLMSCAHRTAMFPLQSIDTN